MNFSGSYTISGDEVCYLNSRVGLLAVTRSKVMMEVATAPQRGAIFAILNSRHGLFAEARSEVMMKVATAPQRGASFAN